MERPFYQIRGVHGVTIRYRAHTLYEQYIYEHTWYVSLPRPAWRFSRSDDGSAESCGTKNSKKFNKIKHLHYTSAENPQLSAAFRSFSAEKISHFFEDVVVIRAAERKNSKKFNKIKHLHYTSVEPLRKIRSFPQLSAAFPQRRSHIF